MSLVPVFKIGVWNAWIFMGYLLLSSVFFVRVGIKKDAASVNDSDMSRAVKMLASASKLILVPALIYSIFLPLELGTMWFYIGLPVTLIGLIAYTVVLINWAAAPPRAVISGGLYRYSRHPMYVTMFVFLLGLAIATASWLFLLQVIIVGVGDVVFIDAEERSCLKHHGKAYAEYMKRTPRWIGIPKSGGNG